MDVHREYELMLTRRQLFGRAATGIGAAALASLLNPALFAASNKGIAAVPGALPATHFAPKAKRVIYLFMSGGPSHIDLFDYKPKLKSHHGEELPASVRMGQRITGMTSGQKSFPCVAPMFKFAQHGSSGTWVSELLPHTASIVDEIAVIKSVNTEAINHDPAITYIQTGSQQPGRPSLGAWLSYGLGSENENLPAFIVMISQGSGNKTDQPLFSRLWGSGFIPTQHQGIRFRSGDDPVLYLSNPPGIDGDTRRRMLDGVVTLNTKNWALSLASAGATTCGPDQCRTLRPPASSTSQDQPGTSAPGWLVLFVEALLICALAGPQLGLVQLSGTTTRTSTVVSSEPPNGTVCSNGARR